MNKRWKSFCGGILTLAAVVMPSAFLWLYVSGYVDPAKSLIAYLFIFPLVLYFSFFPNDILTGSVLILGAILIVIPGGTYALVRGSWGWAAAGSVGAFVLSPLLGVFAIVLILWSQKEFPTKTGKP